MKLQDYIRDSFYVQSHCVIQVSNFMDTLSLWFVSVKKRDVTKSEHPFTLSLFLFVI